VFVLGALGMVGASLLAAVAQTGGMPLAARALDGLASAAIAPMALALIASALAGLGVFVFASSDRAKAEGRRLDGIGALTCAAGLLWLVFGIIQINQVGLLHPRVLESLAVGIGSLLAFIWRERGQGIHYWTLRFFAIAPSLWPSRPDYWPRWSSG
jgi:hypothetical protein